MLLYHQAIGRRSRVLTWSTDFKLEIYCTRAYTINNWIPTPSLGAVLENAHGTVDSAYYKHYTSPSTVEANWGLVSLGRSDPNSTVPGPLNDKTVPRLGPRVAASSCNWSSSGGR
ncbi:hypothetical protein EDB86DRAFT_2941706 [Lactarius hatsudake]|nr:hypothetical protein EDB86DRAFT_2941706 [Lactarius hatsudake]